MASAKKKLTAPKAPDARSGGTVKVRGTVYELWLVSGSKRYNSAGKIPAGTYHLEAKFSSDSKLIKMGSVTVADGKTTHVRCDDFMMQCK